MAAHLQPHLRGNGYDPTERPSPYPNTDAHRAYMRAYMAKRNLLKREHVTQAEQELRNAKNQRKRILRRIARINNELAQALNEFRELEHDK